MPRLRRHRFTFTNWCAKSLPLYEVSPMGTADKTLTCRDCGMQFTFSAHDQEFFASKGYNPPTRCPSCRHTRKGGSTSNQRPPKECFGCGGTGQIRCTQLTCIAGYIMCFACQGTGVKTYASLKRQAYSPSKPVFGSGPCNKCVELGYPTGRLPCRRCDMTGYLTCRKCGGTGYI